MNIIVLVLTLCSFGYAVYVHSQQMNNPEEHPARIVVLLTFISAIFQFAEILGTCNMLDELSQRTWQIVGTIVAFKIAYFINTRRKRIKRG